MSGFKKTVFDKLVLAMVTLQQQSHPEPTAKPKTATKRSKNFIEAVEARAKGMCITFIYEPPWTFNISSLIFLYSNGRRGGEIEGQ